MAQENGAQHVNPARLPATLNPVSTRCFTAVCSPDRRSFTASAKGFILNSAVGAKQRSGKLLMLNQCLCLESSTMANPFGEAR